MITIYLADLTHCTMTISNDAFPLNVGLVGAYTKKSFLMFILNFLNIRMI